MLFVFYLRTFFHTGNSQIYVFSRILCMKTFPLEVFMGRKKKKDLKKLLRKNAELARKHGYDRHYFVERLGIPIEKCGTNFCGRMDKRYGKWMKERKKYGFDSRETWSLDSAFYTWLYERLMMYKKEASKVVNLSFHKFDIDGREYTQIEAIDEMLRLLEKILKSDGLYDKKQAEMEHRIALIWAEVLPAMWW